MTNQSKSFKKRKLSLPQIVAIGLIVGSLVLIGIQATSQESSVTFYTPSEIYGAQEKFTKKTFRMGGLVLAGSKTWDSTQRLLTFQLTDLKGHDFAVVYRGIPPDLFKEGQGAVVEGRLRSSGQVNNPEGVPAGIVASNKPTIDATLVMVKHSEVYDEKKDHSEMREAKLLDSLLKDQRGATP